jgi:hypothetical protein
MAPSTWSPAAGCNCRWRENGSIKRCSEAELLKTGDVGNPRKRRTLNISRHQQHHPRCWSESSFVIRSGVMPECPATRHAEPVVRLKVCGCSEYRRPASTQARGRQAPPAERPRTGGSQMSSAAPSGASYATRDRSGWSDDHMCRHRRFGRHSDTDASVATSAYACIEPAKAVELSVTIAPLPQGAISDGR